MDLSATVLDCLGPAGAAFSTIYFVADTASGGFGGWGNIPASY